MALLSQFDLDLVSAVVDEIPTRDDGTIVVPGSVIRMLTSAYRSRSPGTLAAVCTLADELLDHRRALAGV